MTSNEFRKWYDSHGVKPGDVLVVRITTGGYWMYQKTEVRAVEVGRSRCIETSYGSFYRNGKWRGYGQFSRQTRLVAPTPETLAATENRQMWDTGEPWVD